MKATYEQFEDLCKRLGATKNIGSTFDCICMAYDERAYHNLDHVGYCLNRLSEMREEASHRGSYTEVDRATWDEIEYALWFHDFHNDGTPEDESSSYNSAIYYGSSMALTIRYSVVGKLIKSTKHDKIPLDYGCMIICDVDLSILGATPEVYKEYTEKVRKEWAHVPDQAYGVARQVIMKRIYDRPWIYMTQYGRTHWNRPAMRNIGLEILELQKMSEYNDNA